MKRFATIIPIIAGLIWTNQVLAVNGATATATTPDSAKQIEDLKERLATKVAELKKTVRKAIFGKVKNVSVTSITVGTKTNDLKVELPDDVVVIQYLKGQRTKLSISDIDKTDSVAVLGDYDATVDIMKAKVIIIQDTVAERISGTITALDKGEYTVTMNGTDGQSYVIDIETTTKAVTWDPANGIQKYGFSKMSVGDSIQVLGTPEKETNHLSAVRILDLGNLTTPIITPTPTAAKATETAATPSPKPTSTPAK